MLAPFPFSRSAIAHFLFEDPYLALYRIHAYGRHAIGGMSRLGSVLARGGDAFLWVFGKIGFPDACAGPEDGIVYAMKSSIYYSHSYSCYIGYSKYLIHIFILFL